MTLKQLEYFLEIARMGSVSKAAQMLNISQPPLSMQLKALEDELGVPLFNRTKRGLEITPEGTLLQERAERHPRSARYCDPLTATALNVSCPHEYMPFQFLM